MTTLATPPDTIAATELLDETPIVLEHRLTGMDRAFRALLATSGAIVLVVLVSILVFLFKQSWWALSTFKLHFFTGTVWSTPIMPGVLGILVGSVLIAVIAIVLGTPVALSIALMINEYVPTRFRGFLTGLVDLLAVVPSIVFGFWGLEALNRYVQGPVSWIADHLGFIPIFRTTEPGTYTDSVFVCGLIVAIMIVPVVASVSREVMAQAPRDACEAALGLGGTRWGSITDVILPFSRSGIVGGVLLGVSRALGETMAVLLVLSPNNVVSKAILGPGNGDVARQVAFSFPTADAHSQSQLTLAGLTLFGTTLVFSLLGRLIASIGRSEPMTMSLTRPAPPPHPDHPNRRPQVSRDGVVDFFGSAIASLASVWLIFSLAGIALGFGFFFCWLVLSWAVYGVLVWRRHGILIMKDRLATVAVWSGGIIALAVLAALVIYVGVKGGPVVFAHFPRFLVNDTTGGKSGDAYGVGQSIVGTLEQVAIATLISVPIAFLTATYMVESRSFLARVVRNVIDAMTGTPSIIAGLFVFIIWVRPHGVDGKNGLVAALTLSIMMVPVTTRAALEVIRIVPGSLREAAHALGAPQWRVAVRVVLPAARAGLITAAILGIARTAGETAEVLFTAGGSAQYNWNPLHGWQDDLPLRIYEQVFQPSATAISVGWGAAFVLMALVLALFTLARVLGRGHSGRRGSWLRRRNRPSDP